MLLQDALQVRASTKRSSCCSQAPTPGELSAYSVIFFHIVLGKARLCIVCIARECKLEFSSRPEAFLDLLRRRTPLALDAYHLTLLDDPDLLPCWQMCKSNDTVWKSTFRIGNRCRVVGNQQAELELGVVVQDMVVLQTCCRSVAVG